MYIISTENQAPKGFRNLTDEEISKDFGNIDKNNDYFISKNEWMLSLIKLYESELEILEKEGPDSIMSKIQELSDEFDRIDTDGNKTIDFYEYKNFITNNIFIEE